MTLNDLRLRFERDYAPLRQAPSTTKLETGAYRKHTAPHFGAAKIGEFTSQDVDRLIVVLAQSRVSPGVINRVRALLHGLFNRAVRWRLVKANPVSEVAPLPTDTRALEKTYSFLTQEEARRLLDWIAAQDPWLYPKVRVLLNCGLRFGEMSALRVQDFAPTPTGAILRVSRTTCRHTHTIRHRTKGRSSRVIPLSHSMATFLEPIRTGKRGDSPLLWGDWKEAFDPWRFGKRFRRALREAQVIPIRVHDLRHTFAVHFLERGGHLYDLQNLLGHSTSKLTERYSHFSLAMVERSCGIVDHHGSGKPKLTVIDGELRPEMSHKCPTKAAEADSESASAIN